MLRSLSKPSISTRIELSRVEFKPRIIVVGTLSHTVPPFCNTVSPNPLPYNAFRGLVAALFMISSPVTSDIAAEDSFAFTVTP